jgi:glycosyltransferase involved in cell wall biosynthesis
MSLGLPVIMPDYSYICKMVDKYKFGICVKPDDISMMAEAICYLYDNPQAAKQMGDNGRCAVSEEFNWKTQEKKLLELY